MKQKIVTHPLYSSLESEDAIRIFMEAHIFCVWDFQCLLKVLQQHFTCTTSPWLPSKDKEVRRFINEIVLGEESDIHPHGGHASHFELYLDAMKEAGADNTPVLSILHRLEAGETINEILDNNDFDPAIVDFLKDTFDCIQNGEIHEVASYFTYGREDLIPNMFKGIVELQTQDNRQQWQLFLFYLERHIELDEEDHGPLAHKMLEMICKGDLKKWQEVHNASDRALASRLKLWDAIHLKIQAFNNET